MRILKVILTILLGFILGMVSTLGGIIGGGYYIVYKTTPEDAEEMIQEFAPEFGLPESFPENLTQMTFLEIFNELRDIFGNLDSLSLNDLQERLGYQLPLILNDGTDISFLFAPVMDIPITSIPDNMNLVVDNITMNSLINLGILDVSDIPDLPMFSSPDSLDFSLINLFSGMDSMKVCDVIDLYRGDYYPSVNGNYVIISGDYTDYDANNPEHKNLTRYNSGYIRDDEGAYVYIDGEYVVYNAKNHSGRQRYSSEMLPDFNGGKVLAGAVYELYDSANPAHQGLRRFLLPDRSPDVLIAIGNAYINKVAEDDPDGKTISDTVNTLQVKDIIDTEKEDAPTILKAIKDAYIGNEAPDDDPDGRTISDTVNLLMIKDVIDIYEEDVYQDGTLIHEKSNQVLIAIKDAYIGSDPPEGGLTIDNTITTLTVRDIMEINDGDVYDSSGQLIKQKSTAILLSIAEAYIGNSVPDDAPAGSKTVATIIDSLQVQDVITICNGGEYVVDESGAFVSGGFIDYDEIEHAGLTRYALNADNTYTPSDEGDKVIEFIPYDSGEHNGMTRYSIAEKSSNVLIGIKDAYIGDNIPPGGKSISEAIDDLTLGEVIDITQDSAQVLKELQHTSIKDLDSTMNTLKLKQTINIYTEDLFYSDGTLYKEKSNIALINLGEAYIGNVPDDDPDGKTISEMLDTMKIDELINIYDGTEYILDDSGEYYRKPAEFEAYDQENSDHIGLPRYGFRLISSEPETGYFCPDDEGEFVIIQEASYMYDPYYADALPKYRRAEASSTLLTSLKEEGSTLESIDSDINNLALGKIITIDNDSSKVLQSLKDTSLNGLNARIDTFKLNDVIDIYDGYEYIPDDNGDYVVNGTEEYDPDNPYHSHLEVYTDGADSWVDKYVPYEDGIEGARYRLADRSALILVSLSDAEINNMDNAINGLTLKDVITIDDNSPRMMRSLKDVYIGDSAPDGSGGLTLNQKIDILTLSEAMDIYETDEYYLDNDTGAYVMDYVLFDEDYENHQGLTRYSFDGTGYSEDINGDYVCYYTPYIEGIHDPSADKYSVHLKSSKFLLSLKDSPVTDLGEEIDNMTLKDMINITDNSPRILHSFADSKLNKLEETILDLRLTDVIDIYHEDIYESDENGYFVFDGSDYVKYTDGGERFTRITGIDAVDNKVYKYDTSGDYTIDETTLNTYIAYDELSHAGLPRYTHIGEKSPEVLISLRDANIYDDGSHDTLSDMLDNLTLVQMLGAPEPDSLMHAVSYYDDGDPLTQDEEVKIKDIENRILLLMTTSKMEQLDSWGIIEKEDLDNCWDDIYDKTLQDILSAMNSPTE
jgi:phosphoribosylformylglycinamidine (FGAM) synthase PurS component